MDLRRLRSGEWLAGISGAALAVALFLPWYEEGGGTVSAWEALAVLDLILAVVALAALAIPFVAAWQRVPAVPVAEQSLTTLAGILAVLLLALRVLDLPGAADGREPGLWLGLLAALGVVAGCLLAIRDERRSPAGRHTDLTGVPLASAPEVETLPAPRPRTGA